MQVEIERGVFLDALSKTVPITEKKSTLPILSYLLLEVNDEKMTITATDLQVGLQIFHECNAKVPGKVTIPGKKLFELIRELPSGSVELKLGESGRIAITAGKSNFELAGMDPSDYPAWSELEGVESTSVPAEKLTRMIDKTMFAASVDDSRFNLNGVLFEQQNGGTRVVATDGHRLAMINEDIGLSLSSQVLIPRKGLSDVRRVLENCGETVMLGFEPKNMVIRTEEFTMTSRLLEGQYPDYRKVLPQGGDKTVKVDRISLLRSLRRVAVLTSDRNKGIDLNLSSGRIHLTATHPDLGKADDFVAVDYDGDELEIIMNVTYLIESLNVFDTESVVLEFKESDDPLIIRPDSDEDYFNLVMPMKR